MHFLKISQNISRKLASFVDEFLCKHTRLQNFVFILADKLIHIIKLTVCNKKVYALFYLCCIVYSFLLGNNIRNFYNFLDIYDYTWSNLVIAYQQFIPIHFVIFFLFIQLLTEMYIICLILISIPCVKSYLFERYGVFVLKQAGLDPLWFPFIRYNMTVMHFFLGYALYRIIRILIIYY